MDSDLLMDTDHDIQIHVVGIPGSVILQFSEMVSSLTYTPEQARNMGYALIAMAENAEKAEALRAKKE